MKGTILAIVACVAVTAAILTYVLFSFNKEHESADATPVARELTAEEKAAATTKCPKEIALVCLQANDGQPESQKHLAVAYSTGKGTKKNVVLGKMWWNIIAMAGNKTAVEKRDILRGKMAPAVIAEADRLTWEWLASHPTRHPPAR